MHKGMIIKTDSTYEMVDIACLEDMQKAVGGRIEAVADSRGEPWTAPWTIYGDEEGRIKSDRERNFLAQQAVAFALDKTLPEILPMYGDFLILGFDPESGENRTIPPCVGVVLSAFSRMSGDNRPLDEEMIEECKELSHQVQALGFGWFGKDAE